MLRRGVSILCCFAVTASGLVAPGCAADQARKEARRAALWAVQDYEYGDFARAAETLAPVTERPDENYVLNNLRLGSAALAAGKLDEAENAFLRAYETINATGVNDPGRTAAAVLFDEKVKVFKGEPYERAMASFYLGLVYYIERDYGNARGAFENALFKLRDYGGKNLNETEVREQESDFALALLMLGRTFQRLGRDDLARANFDRVLELRPKLAALADFDRQAESNLLLVVDVGFGPQRVTDFDGAVIGFAPTPAEAGPIPRPYVAVDGRRVELGDAGEAPVDLLALAQDRRWQTIDTIRTTKGVIGTGLIAGGGLVGLNELTRRNGARGENLAIAAALIGAGLLAKASSRADTRHWEMLPRTTLLLPLRVAPGEHDVQITFPAVPGLRDALKVDVPAGGEATYYVRMIRQDPPGVYGFTP